MKYIDNRKDLKKNMKVITINIPKIYNSFITKIIEVGLYPSRSEFVRHAISHYIGIKLNEINMILSQKTIDRWTNLIGVENKNSLDGDIIIGDKVYKTKPLINPNKVSWESDVKW